MKYPLRCRIGYVYKLCIDDSKPKKRGRRKKVKRVGRPKKVAEKVEEENDHYVLVPVPVYKYKDNIWLQGAKGQNSLRIKFKT